jgi:hypothetical protein
MFLDLTNNGNEKQGLKTNKKKKKKKKGNLSQARPSEPI